MRHKQNKKTFSVDAEILTKQSLTTKANIFYLNNFLSVVNLFFLLNNYKDKSIVEKVISK